VVRLLQNIRHDIRVYRLTLGMQFRAAATLRAAFVIQIVGMMLNNSALIIAWLFLFNRFGTINGWSASELVGLQGINMLVFGMVMLLSVGILDLPRHVDQGSFDSFLTRPSSLLTQLASSNVDVSTIGDFLMGLGLTIWYIAHAHANATAIILFLALMLIGSVIFWSFTVLLPNLLAFYMFDSERLSRYFGFVFLDTSMYPTGVLTGSLRTVLLTAVPGLFVGAVQVDVLRGLHWSLVLLGLIVMALWLAFSLWLFRRAVRKYESANLVGAR